MFRVNIFFLPIQTPVVELIKYSLREISQIRLTETLVSFNL
jgi:hypothetical protein